jgi:hypothetical protein
MDSLSTRGRQPVRFAAPEAALAAMIDAIFRLGDAVRYVAVYRDGQLEMRSRPGTAGASSAETDRYEELLVNPTLLKLASQRGNIDCGGLESLLVRYGNFSTYVLPTEWGHVAVGLELDADAIGLGRQIADVVRDAS